MGGAFIIAKQILVMFLYMAVGCLLFRRGLVTKEGSRSMANLLLYVVLPCVVIRPFCVERTPERVQGLFLSIVLAAALLAAAMLISHILFRRFPIDDFSSSFSNAGFMGFPLITAALGADAVFYAAGFVALLNVLQWTYGQFQLSGDRGMCSPAAVIKNPLVLAMAAGLVIFYTGIPVPSVLSTALTSLSALNGPLAMVILGVYLAQADLRSLFSDPHLYVVSAVRLIVIPAVSFVLMKCFLHQSETIGTALLLACSAPVGSNVAVYAQKLGLDYTYAVKLVCLSTILSIVTMPLLLLI